MSLSYAGGGEKWVAGVANELVRRGHQVEIKCLPFTAGGSRKSMPELDERISYAEAYFHKVNDSDIAYITYHPLHWINFRVNSVKIAGFHSQVYWRPVNPKHGLLPTVANLAQKLFGNREAKKFDAVHTISDVWVPPGKNVWVIPNFSDSQFYHPTAEKNKRFTVGFASRKVWSKGFDLWLELKRKLNGAEFMETQNTPEGRMPEFYSRCHVTFVPTRQIPCLRAMTTSLTVIESNLCGTPVLCINPDDRGDVPLPLICAKDIDEACDELTALQQMPRDAYFSLSQRCRKNALVFDKQTVVDKIEQMFRSVITK